MFVHLHNKQREIASVALSAFIGGWLLLLCQTCLAMTDDVMQHHEPVSEVSNSCHIPEGDTHNINLDDEHCLGACDCDAITVTINTDKGSELKEKIKFFPDVVAIITPKLTLSNRAPPNYPLASFPDRAKLSPFYTYNVLLI